MTPETLIRSMILCFPSESSDRLNCLFTAFSNSAMYWKNGEIESEFDYEGYRKENPPLLTTEEVYAKLCAKRTADGQRALQRALETGVDEREAGSRAYCPKIAWEHKSDWESATQTAAVNTYVYNDIDYLVANGRVPKFMGDISYHSLLLSMPDDVTDAWLKAAEEVCRALAEIPHSSYIGEQHLHPKPYDRDVAIRQARATDELFDKEILSDEEYGKQTDAWQESLKEERVMLFEADKGVVESHLKLSKDGLARIAEIKALRA